MRRLSLAIALSLTCSCLQAQWFNQRTVGIPRTAEGKPDLSAAAPKTHDGKPDLSGVWTLMQTGGGLSQLKPADIQPWAQALSKQREENFGRDNPGILCLPEGNTGGFTKFVQTPGLLVMLGEDLTYRQIFLDGRELPKDPNPAWMGYSVGHWEGDTLVVESTGYNDRTWLERGYPHSENMRKTERYHRRDFGHLDVDITISDPKIYAKPWTEKLEGLFTADTELLEYVCAENEKDKTHLIGKLSDDTKNAVKVAPAILSKYVGTYEFNAKEVGVPGPEFLLFKVTLKDGALEMGLGDGPKMPLNALSETAFTGVGGNIEFVNDDKGQVTHMTIRIAEGDFKAKRR
jgi:uncharacterized protein DUF3471